MKGIEMDDLTKLFKNRNMAKVLAKLADDERATCVLGNIGTFNDFGYCLTQKYFISLIKYFKPYTGFTKKRMKEIHSYHRTLVEKKMEKNKLNTKLVYRATSTPGRIYPLSDERYNRFAKTLWEKRGCPRFKKRIISGVKFGEPETSKKKIWGTAGYCRWVVNYRFIGCQIERGKLILGCADSDFLFG